MQVNSVKNNFLFQVGYQLLIFLIPLIVAPYLTRTLGSGGLGNYSYVNTFVSYAGLIANLGISTYGQRLIASVRNDKKLLRKSFWSLYYLHLFSSVIALIFYFFIILFIGIDSKMSMIQGLFVLAMVFDVTWLFYGLEYFKIVVLKNGLIKCLECILIFSLIKHESDIYLYSFIMSASSLFGFLIMLPQAFKITSPIKVSINDIKEHLGPVLLLFVSVVAVTIYTVFDKTLLGWLISNESVAYYEYSAKIIEIPKQLLNALGMVILPRACYAFSKGRNNDQKYYFDLSIFLTCMFGSAFAFGLSAISEKFTLLYYGQGFAECGKAIVAMSPLIIVVLLGNVYRTVYIIPSKQDKQLTFCLILSSMINIVLSLLFIPLWGLYGAIIGTLSAESFGLIFQAVYCRKYVSFTDVLFKMITFLIIGFIMYSVVSSIDSVLNVSVGSLAVEILTGAIIYFILSLFCTKLCFKHEWKSFMEVIRKIYNRKLVNNT